MGHLFPFRCWNDFALEKKFRTGRKIRDQGPGQCYWEKNVYCTENRKTVNIEHSSSDLTGKQMILAKSQVKARWMH